MLTQRDEAELSLLQHNHNSSYCWRCLVTHLCPVSYSQVEERDFNTALLLSLRWGDAYTPAIKGFGHRSGVFLCNEGPAEPVGVGNIFALLKLQAYDVWRVVMSYLTPPRKKLIYL